MLLLVFKCNTSLESEPSFYDRTFSILVCPTSLVLPHVAGVQSWGLLIFVIVTLSAVSATEGVELTSLASMAQVLRLVSSLTGMSEWNPGLSFITGSA